MTGDRPAADALRLEKITFDYVPREDRMLARVLAVDGERSALWITQRLALRLAHALARHLERTTACDNQRHRDILQSFRHQAALLASQPGAPVEAVDASNAPLLDMIDVRLFEQQVELQLMLGDRPAVLSLSNDHVRQLLQILLDMFRRAEWPINCWPAWMREPVPAAAGGSLPLH